MTQTDEEFLATIPDRDEADEVFLANIPDKREMSNEEAYSRLMYPIPTAEEQALEEDFIPAMIGGIALTPVVGPAIGMGVLGRSVLSRAVRGTVQAGVATLAEGTYIKPLEEIAGEIHPYLRPIVGIVAGMGSAITIEALGSEVLLKALTQSAPNFWSKQLGLAQEAGLLEKEFLKSMDDIIAKMDMGDTEAIQKALNRIRTEVHGEVLSRASKKLNKMRTEKPIVELPPTEKVLKEVSKKNILDDYDYRKIAQVAERDTIAEYTKEFDKVKKEIIDEYWKVEKDLVNSKVSRSAIEYKYRDEFDRMFRDEILVRTQEKESEYLAKVLGVKELKPGASNVKAVMNTMSELSSLENVVKEVSSLRNVTRRIANIIRKQTTKEMTVANKAKIERLREAYNQRMLEYKTAVKIKSDTAIIQKRLNSYLGSGKGMRNEYREQIENFLAPMFGKQTKKLDESMFAFLKRKYNDELSIGADILVKRYAKMLLNIGQRTKNFDQFSFKQIKDIDDFTKAFQFMGKNERFITYEAGKRLTEEVANEIATSARKGMSKYSAFKPRMTGTQLEEISKVRKGAVGKFIESSADLKDGFFAALKRMEPIIRQLDGFEEFGTAYKQIFNKTVMAEVAKEKLGQEVFSKWRKVFGDHRIAAGMGRRPGKYWTATSGNLAGYKIDKETAIAMALNTGNKGNMEAMLKGLGVEKEELTSFLKTALNDADRKFVGDVWDLLDELFPTMKQVYKDMTGLTLQKISKGRYYPIKADPKYLESTERFEDLFKAEVNPDLFWAGIEKGFTKARIGGVKSVKLSLRPLTQHLEDVVHMVTHWKPVNEIQRLIRHSDFKEAVKETMGNRIYDQFDPWLKNLARPSRTAYGNFLQEKSLGKLRRNVTVVALGVVPKVGVKQTLSLITALPEVGHRNMLASIIKFGVNPRRFLNAVNEASPEMMFRQKTWQRDLAEIAAKYDHKGALKGGVANLYFKFIHMFDRFTASTVWHGSYLKGLDNFSGDANKAVNFANMIVRKTQPASAAKDLPAIMRSGEVNRSITMFYSYYSVYHNQAMEIVQRGLAGNMSVPKVLSTLAYLAIAPAVSWYGATVIWNKMTGRPEEEFDGWELAKAVGVNTLSGIPMARDGANAAIMGYDYRVSPLEDVGTELVDTSKAIAKIFQEDEEFTREDFVSSMELAGYMFNLPTRQAITTVLGAQRLLSGESDDWTELIDRPKYKK